MAEKGKYTPLEYNAAVAAVRSLTNDNFVIIDDQYLDDDVLKFKPKFKLVNDHYGFYYFDPSSDKPMFWSIEEDADDLPAQYNKQSTVHTKGIEYYNKKNKSMKN